MITKRDWKFIDLVKRHAVCSDKVSGARVSAVIVIKNRPIAFGTNQRKTHPFQAEYGKNEEAIYLHAETDAIKNALRFVDVEDLRHATLYVCRVKNETSDPKSKFILGMARPCKKGCMQAIVDFKIKKVVYTNDEQDLNILLRQD